MNACSFCSKAESEVKRLIAGGPGTFICDRCVALCSTLLAQEAKGGGGIPRATESGVSTKKRIKTSDTEPDLKVSTTPAPVPLQDLWSQTPEFKPISGRDLPRFAGIATFFRLPHWERVKGANVAILGVPFDGGTTYRPGTRFAPRALRDASAMGRAWQTGTKSDVFAELKCCDAGDVAAIPTDLKKTFEKVEKRIAEIADAGAIPLVVGGDHTVTLPVLRALKKKNPKRKLGVVHFDAHLDTYPPAWDVDYHHGTTFRHVVEEGLAEGKHVIQIGIRGPLASKEDLDFAKKHSIDVVMIDEVREKGPRAVASRFEKLRGLPVYVSFDIDGLDPAFAPGTGTPVPGGLTTWEAQVILRALAGLELCGFDVVEVSPAFDPSGITQLAAVTLMQEWLGALAMSRRKR